MIFNKSVLQKIAFLESELDCLKASQYRLGKYVLDALENDKSPTVSSENHSSKNIIDIQKYKKVSELSNHPVNVVYSVVSLLNIYRQRLNEPKLRLNHLRLVASDLELPVDVVELIYTRSDGVFFFHENK